MPVVQGIEASGVERDELAGRPRFSLHQYSLRIEHSDSRHCSASARGVAPCAESDRRWWEARRYGDSRDSPRSGPPAWARGKNNEIPVDPWCLDLAS